jgi:hypothetical protein
MMLSGAWNNPSDNLRGSNRNRNNRNNRNNNNGFRVVRVVGSQSLSGLECCGVYECPASTVKDTLRLCSWFSPRTG